jgi:hypothetical protein
MKTMNIDSIFVYHSPTTEQTIRYREIRSIARLFAELIIKSCPDSRERDLAIDNVRQAVMWANASIAVNEK